MVIRSALLSQGHKVSWILRRDEPLHALAVQAGDQIVATLWRRGVNHANGGRWFAACGNTNLTSCS